MPHGEMGVLPDRVSPTSSSRARSPPRRGDDIETPAATTAPGSRGEGKCCRVAREATSASRRVLLTLPARRPGAPARWIERAPGLYRNHNWRARARTLSRRPIRSPKRSGRPARSLRSRATPDEEPPRTHATLGRALPSRPSARYAGRHTNFVQEPSDRRAQRTALASAANPPAHRSREGRAHPGRPCEKLERGTRDPLNRG